MTWSKTPVNRITGSVRSLSKRRLPQSLRLLLCALGVAWLPAVWSAPSDLIVDGANLLAGDSETHETVPLRAVFRKPNQSVVITSEQRELVFYEHAGEEGELSLIPGITNLWNWQPDPSVATASLEIFRNDERRAQIRAFTLHEFDTSSDARLGKFRIGRYPRPSRAPNPIAYPYPAGLIQVTPANREHRVSDHFRLEQFLCKQPGGWPKYVALQQPLLTKLDALVRALQARGIDVETLSVMSGYRTPAYNKAIGNVAYSRHIYGDAADIFVDRDGNGRMDDLNGDGRVNINDARWLAAVVASLSGADIIPGGTGTYGSNAAHGPFVHVDARGKAARWGAAPLAVKELARN